MLGEYPTCLAVPGPRASHKEKVLNASGKDFVHQWDLYCYNECYMDAILIERCCQVGFIWVFLGCDMF